MRLYSERICFTKLIFIPLTESSEHEVMWDLLTENVHAQTHVSRAVLSIGF